MRIVFFGTPEFAVASLDRLVKNGHDIAGVVTMPDKPAGRGHKMLFSDVKKYALEHNLPLFQPVKLRDPEFLEALRALHADLFVVIAFRMLPEAVWGMPPKGTFNLHGSLLPKYRGAAPINRAIMKGEKETGVTTFFLTHEIDTGDIISSRSIIVGDDEDAGSVHDRLMEIGAELVSENVKAIEEGTVTSVPQPEGDFTPAPKIFKEDCRIVWNAPARKVHDQIRGLAPYPAAFSTLVEGEGRRLDIKILKAVPVRLDAELPEPGEVKVEGRRMFVAANDGFLEILELQPAGKKRMAARDFLLGYHPVKFLAEA